MLVVTRSAVDSEFLEFVGDYDQMTIKMYDGRTTEVDDMMICYFEYERNNDFNDQIPSPWNSISGRLHYSAH